MASTVVNFLSSLLVTVTMAQIIHKQNMNVSSILKAHGASSQIPKAPHMQAPALCSFSFMGLIKRKKINSVHAA